jgi:ABC-type transport system involved in cytochrome bd biosynthesis fused ATPase/permease subunit
VAEVRPLVAVARPWLAGAIAVGVGQAVLLVAQAAVLARLLADALYGELSAAAAAQAAIAVALLAVGQGLAGWAWEAYTEAASRRSRAATRRRALARAIRLAASARRLPPDGACRQVADDGEMGPGGLATLLGAGINELDAFVGRVLPRTVLVLAVPALLLAWIAHLDLVSAGLAALVLVVAPVLAVLVGMDTAAAVRRRLASLERLGDRFAALIEELPVLRAFGRAQDHEQSVAASGEDVRAATLATLRVALLAGLVLELLAAVGTALVAVRLGLRLDAGQRILPQALAVLMLTPEVFLPLRRLTADFHAAATGRAALARLAGLIAADRPADPAEQSADDGGLVAADGMATTTGGAPVAAGGALVGGGRGPVSVQCMSRQADPGPLGVVLDGVCLTVGGRSQPVLDEIDLRILPGERVCLTGQSGAGKSSLLRVVAGLVPASAGCSRLEGRAGGRPALGWVPQHPTVLTATILDNVALGRPGVDEGSARAALETVGLGTWLRSMPEGLRTPLSGLDAPLSLGERRRLAVARSLAGPRPRLWLLDEPTAGLDRASTERLVAELGRITDGVTAIIATHDPAAMTLGQRTVELCLGRVRAGGREQPRPGHGANTDADTAGTAPGPPRIDVLGTRASAGDRALDVAERRGMPTWTGAVRGPGGERR